jgi:hypothetical protein
MYNRGGNSSLPTLTDHFKQALSMTRAQLQAGPSPLTSASQMGVGSSPFVNPVTNAPFTSNVPLPPVQDAVYGSPALPGDVAESSGGGITELLFSYGKWILLALLIAGAVGAYFWWKKRKVASSDDLVEEITNNLNDLSPQRSMQRPIHRLNNQNTNPSSFANNPFGPSRFSANPPTSPLPPIIPNQPPSVPENLRDNEQRTSVRGAEFSNPSIMSQMVPMSTRLKPPEPTQSMPPTDLPRQPQLQQPPPVQQQSFQQQPPAQEQMMQSLPPISMPSPPISASMPPISAPPTQLVAPSLPMSQPPVSVDVPISSTQVPQMVQSSLNQADPNFTAI